MRLLLTLFALAALTGCGASRSAFEANEDDQLPQLVTLQRDELRQLLEHPTQPVLVEFSVLAGCVRCVQLRPQARQLALEHADRVKIVRADFTTNQPQLQSLGATLCPTYVLFTPDQPPQVHTSPEVLIGTAENSRHHDGA